MGNPEHPSQTSSQGQTKLHFIVSTTSPKRAKGNPATQHLVRVQAGRHGRNSSSTTQSAFSSSPSDTFPAGYGAIKKNFTSRIKLASWTRKSGRKKANQTQRPDQKDTADSKALGAPDPKTLPVWSLVQELDLYSFLPITFFPGTVEIMSFYGSMKTNSFALNPDGDFFEFALGDTTALHALVSTFGCLRSLSYGIQEDPTVLQHQAEAVRLINQRLTTERNHFSDGLIMAVSVLVNQATMSTRFLQGKIHLDGLAKMIEMRGGVEQVNSRLVLQRVITWGDFCFSSAWGQPLRFPAVQSLYSIPERDITERSFHPIIYEPEDVRYPGIVVSDISVLEAMDTLQDITQSLAKSPLSSTERRAISNAIYHVEYELCRSNSAGDSDGALQLVFNVDALDLSAPLATAAQLFLHLGIRNLPAKAQRHQRLFNNLRMSLPQVTALAYLTEIPQRGLNILLWMYAIGAANEADPLVRGTFLADIEAFCRVMGLRDHDGFAACLKDVLWAEPFCKEHASCIWEDVGWSLRLD
ncbi:hypothetical protein BCR34DRAFT_593790 [Clohesyomyces aquaticus]|uniref:Fungal-specific transcription factor domain-domain-containing protein n=1 Tax=Clohesyomyces aquaticus TaxID=1231657 RepID=A0A1Y1YFH4_9PLEO|nr:hypothetical protein BCR34DRAFT_593790 [Clohesyomyces aquaticus]